MSFLRICPKARMKSFYFLFLTDHALVGYGMKTAVVDDEFECQLKCIANDSCKSFNVHLSSSKANRRICELNNKTRQMKPKDFKPKKGSIYYGYVKVRLSQNTYEWSDLVLTNQGPKDLNTPTRDKFQISNP